MDVVFNMEIMAYNRNRNVSSDNIYLMFRPIGVNDREEYLKEKITEISQGSTFVMDFKKIKLVDVSYIDEILLVTLMSCQNGNYGDRYIAVQGMNEGIKNNLEAAIAWRFEKFKCFVPVINKENGKNMIIGSLEKSLQETYNYIYTKKSVNSKDLVNQFNIDHRNASTRLKRLFDYRLIKRSEVCDSEGKYYEYTLI